MNWLSYVALTIWFVALVMLCVAPIDYLRQASFGEDSPRLQAQVVAHTQGAAIPGSPGDYYVAVVVEWPTQGAWQAGRKVIYEFDPVPSVGQRVELAVPRGELDQMGPPISRGTRLRGLFNHLGLCVLVVGLGFVFWMSARPGAPLWSRYAPLVLMSSALAVLGWISRSTAHYDRLGQVETMAVTKGRVVSVEPSGYRSLGGRATAPLYAVGYEYFVGETRREGRMEGWSTAPAIGTALTVRYSYEDPRFTVVDEARLAESTQTIGAGLMFLGGGLTVLFLALWGLGWRGSSG
jgi:hypothetical protein